MSTGAVHLELVSDLSSEAFIAALVRFVSRRGLCQMMFSDNGTCFEGADNDLQKILIELKDEIETFCIRNSIKWNFTTPYAPHAGGIYESGIKSTKFHLKRIMEDKLYTFEQFTTILCKVEAVLNSRPLTPLSDDPNDCKVLTPGHFLVGRPLIAVPQRNFVDTPMNRLTRWQGLQKVQRQFWDMWYHDYLHQLQTRPKKFREVFQFAVGDMVLINDKNLPPMKWLLGRIIRLIPSKDTVIRNVEIRTKNGLKERHVKYLSLLPMEESPEAGECVPTE
jgi:Family of unknown function (DUF5641)